MFMIIAAVIGVVLGLVFGLIFYEGHQTKPVYNTDEITNDIMAWTENAINKGLE